MRMFQQNWARIAFPHPQPARKKRLLPPLFENERSPQAEFNEMCVHESPLLRSMGTWGANLLLICPVVSQVVELHR